MRIFPLPSALLLPGGILPLNIFEPRYRAMVAAALASDKRIGMVHPRVALDGSTTTDELMPFGCAGIISDCTRLPDGRYSIVLEGVQRFEILRELPMDSGGFRVVETTSTRFVADSTETPPAATVNRQRLLRAARQALPAELSLNSAAVERLSDTELVDALAMHVPLPVWDKQALLEADAGQARANILLAALECAAAIRLSAGPSTREH